MHWSWQNLNDRHGRLGSGWREGRAWLWLKRTTLRVEWSHFRRSYFALEVRDGGGDNGSEVQLHVSLWFGSWWLSVDGLVPRAWQRDSVFGSGTGLQLDGDRLSFKWRCDSSQWPPKFGREWSIHFLDILLGQTQYREGQPEVSRITVAMPERAYMGTVTLRDDSWKRPRWLRRTIRRAHITMDEGEQIPVPGKGENAWDCDEDAVYGLTTPARTVVEAVTAIRESVMNTRRTYGGASWRPAVAHPRVDN